MRELKGYFDIFRGIPAFKDELNPVTHHAIEVFIADKKLVAQKTLDGRELIISSEFGENQGESPEIKRKSTQPRRAA